MAINILNPSLFTPRKTAEPKKKAPAKQISTRPSGLTPMQKIAISTKIPETPESRRVHEAMIREAGFEPHPTVKGAVMREQNIPPALRFQKNRKRLLPCLLLRLLPPLLPPLLALLFHRQGWAELQGRQ